MSSARWRRPGAFAAVLAVPAAVILVSALHRVPAGSVAAHGDRLSGPGWRLKAPFTRARTFPASGRLAALDLTRRTPEGSDLVIRFAGSYHLDPVAAAKHARALTADGPEAFAARLAEEALAPIPTAALLPPNLPAESGRAPLPAPAIEAVVAALARAGIETTGLTGRIGPAISFASSAVPPAGDTGLRVVLIGLDGADWDLVDPLLREGRLPHLAGLLARGIGGPLRSYDPMISPLLWTTMATGVGPDVHGVADFQAIDASTGRRVPITSRFRKVKAIWNILSESGLPSGFVGWWASYPVEAVEGFQVSNLVAFETLRPRGGRPASPGLTFPPDYFDSILPRLVTVADLTPEDVRGILHIGRDEFEGARRAVLEPPDPAAEDRDRRLVQQPVPLVLSILAGSRNYATIGADLAARRLRLTAVYFEGIDMMGHRFQHCLPPRAALCPDADFGKFKDAVTGFYARQDRLLGEILEAAGDDATVMVVSDHGFKSGAGRPAGVLPYTTQQPVEWHDEDGIVVLSGRGARHGRRLLQRATLFDIAPTLLYLLGLPVADDMPGRVLFEAIDPGFARAHPPRTIPSYETAGRSRDSVLAQTLGGSEEAEAELLANLRALGYIGGDGDEGGTAGDDAAASQAGGPARAPVIASAGGAAPESETAAGTQVFYHRNLATYFLKRRDYAQAAAQLRLANRRQPLGKTYQLLAEACLGMGRIEDAITALDEGLRTLGTMDPESVLFMVQIGLAEPGVAGGGAEAAAALARQHAPRTATKPGLDDAIQGLLLDRQGRTAEAVAAFRRSLVADPTRVIATQRLYALLPAGERAGTLEPILRQALARDPRIDEYHNLLGILLAERGREDESLAAFQKAEALDPQNPRFAANLAGALARDRRWEEAAAAYERAALLQPSAPTYMKLGSAYRRLNDPGRALAAFERARGLDAEEAGPFLGIALAHAEMNRVDRALEALREGLGRHPDDPALQSLYRDLLNRTRNPGSTPGRTGSGR